MHKLIVAVCGLFSCPQEFSIELCPEIDECLLFPRTIFV